MDDDTTQPSQVRRRRDGRPAPRTGRHPRCPAAPARLPPDREPGRGLPRRWPTTGPAGHAGRPAGPRPSRRRWRPSSRRGCGTSVPPRWWSWSTPRLPDRAGLAYAALVYRVVPGAGQGRRRGDRGAAGQAPALVVLPVRPAGLLPAGRHAAAGRADPRGHPVRRRGRRPRRRGAGRPRHPAALRRAVRQRGGGGLPGPGRGCRGRGHRERAALGRAAGRPRSDPGQAGGAADQVAARRPAGRCRRRRPGRARSARQAGPRRGDDRRPGRRRRVPRRAARRAGPADRRPWMRRRCAPCSPGWPMPSATARWLPSPPSALSGPSRSTRWPSLLLDGMDRMVPPDALREVSADVRADLRAEREETA